MGSRQYFAKQFPQADNKRWYIELVLHGKKEWDEKEAWSKYMFTEEQELLDYHEFVGCYLKVMREEFAYQRTPQGQIDMLRDEIVDMQTTIDELRKNYANSMQWGNTEMQEFWKAQAEWYKECIADNQKQIIKIMTGRK